MCGVVTINNIVMYFLAVGKCCMPTDHHHKVVIKLNLKFLFK